MSFHNLFFLHNIVFAISLFFLGSITASFLLCMGDRILQSKKFFTRSKCPQCNTKLPFYTLIPLLSYLFLLGKCHSCKKNIGLRYPLSEIIYGDFGLAKVRGLFFYKSGIYQVKIDSLTKE